MPVLDTLVAVIPMLGLLIVVHELGHFLVAKACGVRVLKFSIGFGSPIGFGPLRARWERNGTEYVIGWIPLGGFVRMLGEPMPGDDPAAEIAPVDARPDEYLDAKSVWQKLAVVFAGPAMNLLLPIVCLLGILWVGFPRPAAIVGTVEASSPAAAAGIRVGDRIVAVDGEPVAWWDEVILPLRDRRAPGVTSLEVERDGVRETVPVELATQKTRDRFGAVVDTGWIGISNRRQAALVGVPDADSEAARSGLRSGISSSRSARRKSRTGRDCRRPSAPRSPRRRRADCRGSSGRSSARRRAKRAAQAMRATQAARPARPARRAATRARRAPGPPRPRRRRMRRPPALRARRSRRRPRRPSRPRPRRSRSPCPSTRTSRRWG
ncbi:MAG: site-2 protease family protein [Deltaproteobacteria bacterium]|nr:site-2 protease family protein [Deltaproteobacteria bacterium]